MTERREPERGQECAESVGPADGRGEGTARHRRRSMCCDRRPGMRGILGLSSVPTVSAFRAASAPPGGAQGTALHFPLPAGVPAILGLPAERAGDPREACVNHTATPAATAPPAAQHATAASKKQHIPLLWDISMGHFFNNSMA